MSMNSGQRNAYNHLPNPEKLAILEAATELHYEGRTQHPCGTPCSARRYCTCDKCGAALEDQLLTVWRARATAARLEAEHRPVESTLGLEDATTEYDDSSAPADPDASPLTTDPRESTSPDPRLYGLTRLQARHRPVS